MDINIILEYLLGGGTAGVMFFLVRKFKKSGCMIRKEPNDCVCEIKTDIDGDGVNDIEVKIGSVSEDVV